MLRIDSKVLEIAENSEEPLVQAAVESEEPADDKPKLTKKQEAEILRRKVDTVGQPRQAGAKIQNVISVSMLSEGWDAKTVTHIMGLRAFSSQLLCEQVVGRGLRRTTYDDFDENGLFKPEYVNIFGVPFTFLPHESAVDTIPPPAAPKTRIEPDQAKSQFEIRWPNVTRINYGFRTRLALDLEKVTPLVLDANKTILAAELAQAIGGKPDLSKATPIDLEKLARDQRLQRIIFETARDVFDQMQHHWKGNKEVLLAQIVGIVERFIASNKISFTPPLFAQEPLRRQLLITLNMTKVVQHIWDSIKVDNQETIEPVFDRANPVRSTAEMATWYTSKPCEPTKRSHINFCVFDGTWEATEAYEIDKNQSVEAWVKNDHLGFEILYIFEGVVKKYRPDFILKLKDGSHLILETKGQDSPQVQAKKKAAEEWVRAINTHGGFGTWRYALSMTPRSDFLKHAA